MALLFKRNVEIQIGDDDDALKIPNSFKIAFTVQKTLGSKSAQGNVTILNLSDESRSFIRTRGKRIRVFAGYDGEYSLLHDGDILRTAPVDEGANRKLIIYFQGRVFSTNSASFTKSYQNTISVRQIVKDSLPSFGLTFDQEIINKIPADYTVPSFSFNGKTSKMLDSLLQPINIQWFERNSQLLFSKKNEVDTTGDVQVLNSNTGLIKTAVQTDRGVNTTSLLNTKLQVGDAVKIESDIASGASFNTYFVAKQKKDAVGFYKIIQATYQGDNWDGKFEVLLQCKQYGEHSE